MPNDNEQIFTLILEPVQQCNLNCTYCYSDKTSGEIMSRRTLRVTLERTARFVEHRGFTQIHLLWHGGEPLLAGLEFFREAVKIAANLFPGICVHNFLQTNGLLLNEDYCIFFREQHFQIGLSLDGFPELHDSMRISADGRGSHKGVLEKFRFAEKNKLRVGLSAVVTRLSLGREQEIYRYFQNLGCGFSINPLIPAANPANSLPYFLRQGEYGTFLCRMFEEWISTEQQRVSVAPLDLYLKAILDDTPYRCQQKPTCVGSHLGVKPSGDAVLCSRFSTQVLGNVHDMALEALFSAPLCTNINRRVDTLTGCHSCAGWSICHGGCPHNALVFSNDFMAKDYFCKDYKLIFSKLHLALREYVAEESPQGAP